MKVQNVLSLNDARCPRCGGKRYNTWFVFAEGRGAYFVMECDGYPRASDGHPRRDRRGELVKGKKHLIRVRVTLGYEPRDQK